MSIAEDITIKTEFWTDDPDSVGENESYDDVIIIANYRGEDYFIGGRVPVAHIEFVKSWLPGAIQDIFAKPGFEEDIRWGLLDMIKEQIEHMKNRRTFNW